LQLKKRLPESQRKRLPESQRKKELLKKHVLPRKPPQQRLLQLRRKQPQMEFIRRLCPNYQQVMTFLRKLSLRLMEHLSFSTSSMMHALLVKRSLLNLKP